MRQHHQRPLDLMRSQHGVTLGVTDGARHLPYGARRVQPRDWLRKVPGTIRNRATSRLRRAGSGGGRAARSGRRRRTS
jgi:hypothetical protein